MCTDTFKWAFLKSDNCSAAVLEKENTYQNVAVSKIYHKIYHIHRYLAKSIAFTYKNRTREECLSSYIEFHVIFQYCPCFIFCILNWTSRCSLSVVHACNLCILPAPNEKCVMWIYIVMLHLHSTRFHWINVTICIFVQKLSSDVTLFQCAM